MYTQPFYPIYIRPRATGHPYSRGAGGHPIPAESPVAHSDNPWLKDYWSWPSPQHCKWPRWLLRLPRCRRIPRSFAPLWRGRSHFRQSYWISDTVNLFSNPLYTDAASSVFQSSFQLADQGLLFQLFKPAPKSPEHGCFHLKVYSSGKK